jgi:ABC-2 type transport system permease protein
MRNLWLVARYEFLKRVRTRSFLLSTLAVPGLIILIGVIGSVVAATSESDLPVGYVDNAGILDQELFAEPHLDEMEDRIELISFADEEAARAALEAEDIQGFYVLPAGYPQNFQVEAYFLDEMPAGDDFSDFVRVNLLARSDLPAGAASWLLDGPDVTVRDLQSGRELGGNAFVNVILTLLGGFFFFFAVMGSAGYLVQVVADEKENRTMEIVITSVTPLQLIAGKAIGLIAVALTQILLWALALAVTLVIAARFVDFLDQLAVPWSFLLIFALYFLPAFALMGGMMIAIGSVVTEVQQGQQIAGVLNLLFIAPFFFFALLFTNPNSPLLTVLTLFPTTSFMTVAMRWGVTGVPTWQLVASWLILAGTAAFMIWLAARIFRRGMLRYGQRLELREVIAALRGAEA